MSIEQFPNQKFKEWYGRQEPDARRVIDATIASAFSGPEPARPSYRYADRKLVVDICIEHFGYEP